MTKYTIILGIIIITGIVSATADGATIDGYILDSNTNNPIQNATVSLEQLTLDFEYINIGSTYSNDTGYYIFDNIPTGEIGELFFLSASADGYIEDTEENMEYTGIGFEITEEYIGPIYLYLIKESKKPSSSSSHYKPANKEPNTPETPDGIIAGFVNINYTYSTKSSDPDNEKIYYWFEWGDGNNSGWVGPYDSDKVINQTYAWNSSGLFNISVKAKDTENAESEWSNISQVLIISGTDLPPETPEITGPTLGDINATYNFTAVTIDPENHTINYKIDWGDNSTYISNNVSSGTQINASHKWLNEGSYLIKVRASDIFNLNSSWSTPLIFTIDLTKPFINISNPVDNENISDIINISANISDLNLARVTFELLNETQTVVAQVNFTNGPFNWKNNTVNYSPGNYTIRVTAYDIANNIESAIVKIIILEKPEKLNLFSFGVIMFILAISIVFFFVRFKYNKN